MVKIRISQTGQLQTQNTIFSETEIFVICPFTVGINFRLYIVVMNNKEIRSLHTCFPQLHQMKSGSRNQQGNKIRYGTSKATNIEDSYFYTNLSSIIPFHTVKPLFTSL